jgi:signal transduction histidine kinase
MNPVGVKESLTRLDINEMIGKSFFDIWPGTKDSEFHKQYIKAQGGQAVDFEALYEPYGFWYRVFAFPLYPGVGVFTYDITSSKKSQANLEEAVASRDRFLSIASHELNTPLASLKLHTQMMERMLPKGIPEERLGKFFEQTNTQIGHLGQIVGDMLDASKIREGRLSLTFEKKDLQQLVANVVSNFDAVYQAEGVSPPQLEVEGINFICEMDVSRIEQVVSNLLTNASKYGNKNPVKVILSEKENNLLLAVKDQGSGIPAENHERIFEQYFRGPQTRGEGLGLGLYIARQIVLGHHGSIWVESTVGHGSVFYVKLPKLK